MLCREKKSACIHGWWQLCLFVLWKCMDVLVFLPRVSSPSSILWAAVLLPQTSASSSSSSIPGLWYFPCFLALCFSSWIVMVLQLWKTPLSQKAKWIQLTLGFSQSYNHPFPAWTCHGFQLTIQEPEQAGLAYLPKILTYWHIFFCPLPSPSLLLLILHSALPKIQIFWSKSVLTPLVSPGFSSFPVKDLGSRTKFGREGFA